MLKHLPNLRRLLATVPLCALAACATDSASKADMDALRVELRNMREQQARTSERLERLERSTSVLRGRAAPQPPGTTAPAAVAPAASQATPAAPKVAVPDLTVVKLKPKTEPAPSLPTRVAVVEPDTEDVEMFVSASPGSTAPAEPSELPSTSAPPSTAALDADYDQAMSALRTGNVEVGVARLQAFAEQNPRNARADNALYFAGLGLIGLKDNEGASLIFQKLIESYPAGDAVLDGMLRLAECRLKLNQREDARALYTRVLTQFPGTAAATQAEQKLASLSP